nr:MAG TPA: hypothetical protein [Caudoviricetes sp.]
MTSGFFFISLVNQALSALNYSHTFLKKPSNCATFRHIVHCNGGSFGGSFWYIVGGKSEGSSNFEERLNTSCRSLLSRRRSNAVGSI